jgi:hypothetical protein
MFIESFLYYNIYAQTIKMILSIIITFYKKFLLLNKINGFKINVKINSRFFFK